MNSSELALESDEYEATAGDAAMLLSKILGRHITEQEIENETLLQQLLDEGNKKLEAVNKHYFVDIVPITIVSEEGFV